MSAQFSLVGIIEYIAGNAFFSGLPMRTMYSFHHELLGSKV